MKEEIILYNEEAEQTILGTVISNNIYLERVADILLPEYFYFPHHKAIYERFIEIGKGSLKDNVTLRTFFENNLKKVGGAKYLAILLQNASMIIDVREYALEVRELAKKREVLELDLEYQEELPNANFNKLTSEFINNLSGLLISDNEQKTLNAEELIDELEKEEKEGKGDKFVPTGFNKLDDMIDGGIYAKTMAIIGARPSVGKTSISQQIILNASKKGFRCFFLSLEVDRKNVLMKFLSNMASVPLWKYRKKRMNQNDSQAWNKAKQDYKTLNIDVNDSAQQNITQIERLVKRQLERKPFDLLVVDYAQIIRGADVRNKNEAQIIKENTSALKAIARSNNISVLVLAQINRKGVEGAEQEPTVNDFKGSGGFEEDADYLFILHRDRMKDKTDGYFSKSGKLILAKQRFGRTGEIPIEFDGEFGRFYEINNNF